MNARVADCARLILHRLVVRWSDRLSRREVRRRRMALKANRVHIGAVQQARIRSAVRRMAGRAAFRLYHIVLVNEWSRRLAVALGADRIHLRRCTQILLIERAVRIVAIGALHQAFFHFVVERHVELRFRFGVALIAKFGLCRRQKLLVIRTVVNAVAAYAAHFVFTMRRVLEIGVLSLVTAQAAGIHFLRGRLSRIENLRDIAAAIDMGLARPVAAFAGHAALAVHVGDACVRV